MTDVESIRFVDRAEAYAEMKVIFAETPEVVDRVEVIDAPVNFHVLPKEPKPAGSRCPPDLGVCAGYEK